MAVEKIPFALWEPEPSPSDNAVLLETIRDLAATRERLGRAYGHITSAVAVQRTIPMTIEGIIKLLDSKEINTLLPIARELLKMLRNMESGHLEDLVVAKKEIANGE